MNYYGYARVSSTDQNLRRLIDALKKEGIPDSFIYKEKISGKNRNREQLKKCIKQLAPGDCLVILSIDRLSRNYDDVIKIWKEVTDDRKANIKVLDMSLLDTTKCPNGIDGKFISNMLLQLMAYLAQKERENIRVRQMEGIRSAKQRGVRFGRPIRVDKSTFIKYYELVKNGSNTIKDVCSKLSICRKSYYNMRNKYVLSDAN